MQNLLYKYEVITMKRFTSSLYLVTDSGLAKKPIEVLVEEAIRGGVDCVQLREKNIATKNFVALAKTVKNITTKYNVPLIINDRIDVALAVDADGVHLGQDDMPLANARKLLPHRMIIGITASTINEAIEAQNGGADYIGASPVFATPTKTDTAAPLGLEGLQEMNDAVTIPVVAIGGINLHNAEDVLLHGADCLAVVSAIVCADDPCQAATNLATIIKKLRKSNHET